MGMKVTDEERKRIIQLYKEYGSEYEVASIVGRARETVHYLLVMEGIIEIRSKESSAIENGMRFQKEIVEGLRHKIKVGTPVMVSVEIFNEKANVMRVWKKGKVKALYKHFAEIEVPGRKNVYIKYMELGQRLGLIREAENNG